MSDRMHPLTSEQLLAWIMGEWNKDHAIFGCKEIYHAPEGGAYAFLGRRVENGIGPAAGPHTQLAQNIIAAYVSGARIFELKTVQCLDGEDLHVSKPCILAEDEGYNCEWSTELTVPQARDEYIRAWVFLHFIAKEYGLGAPDGFLFNMSVGYDLDGIKSEKIDHFIESLKDASNTESFRECRELLRARLGEFTRFTEADLDAISPNICSSVTVSTMHGCPPEETERIAMYLLEEKKLNLFLKCNPTLIGYDKAKRVLGGLGFHYIHFEKESFDKDLSFEEAKDLLKRVKERAEALGLFFGVKMTNTFPVLADHGDLPDKMMYMSGRALLPLSLRAASMISEAFDGEISISYCGGADDINIGALFSCGLYPVTVCTDLLKPGGYSRFARMAKRMEGMEVRRKPDGTRIARLAVFLGQPASAKRVLKRTPHSAPQTADPCRSVCGVCASLCPNRANVIVQAEGNKYMVHLDRLCNECGNCASFCPEKKAPYLERVTVFASRRGLENSQNCGFAYSRDTDSFLYRWRGETGVTLSDHDLPEELRAIAEVIRLNCPWLL